MLDRSNVRRIIRLCHPTRTAQRYPADPLADEDYP